MRRKLFSMSIIIILLMTLIPLPGTAGTAPAEHPDKAPAATITEQQSFNSFSRQSPYAGAEKGLLHWVYESGLHTVSTPVIGSDGTAYFTAGKELVAVDRTGKKLWSWHSAVTLTNSPELGSDGKIFITTEEGDLFALDSSGSESWEFKHTPLKNTALASCSSCSTGPDGTVYYIVCYNSLTSSAVTLYAVNPYGTLKWSSEKGVKGTLARKPVINNDGTIFAEYMTQSWISGSGRFFSPCMATYVTVCAYKSNGDIISENRIQTNNVLDITPFCPDSEGGVFVGVEKTLYLVKQTSQHRLFECSDSFMETNGVALTNDEKIVFTSGSVVYSCDLEGALQWKFDADSNITGLPMVDKKGNVFFSSTKGSLYCLDPKGKEKWKSTLTGKVYGSSPVIRNDGVIYQFTSSGDLNTVGKTEVKSVSLNAHKVTLLLKGMKGILKPGYSPYNTIDNSMEWSSSNPSVATVNDGVVTPVSVGKARIKVYSKEENNVSDVCEVTVVSKPETDMVLTCDTVLRQTMLTYQGVFTFNNLTLNDGVTLTSEGTSETELIVKGILNIGKNASIRVRNGYYPSAPTIPVSSLSVETLKNVAILRNTNVLNIRNIYGKGGNGGAGGDGSYSRPKNNSFYYGSRTDYMRYPGGGGGGGGGYGGGNGGNGGSTEQNSRMTSADEGFGKSGDNDGKNGGIAYGYNPLGNDFEIAGGEGGGALKTGNEGITGNYTFEGGTGGGGNGGNGGASMFGAILIEEEEIGYLGGGGGGGGGYGGGVLVIAAGSINVKPGNIPCFIVSGQMGGKGGYPNGQDGQNGEGGLLVIETNSYRPSLSHWNIGTGSIECNNPGINGGHGTVTGNPQKVFINGRDMSSYDEKSINSFNTGDRSAALIVNIGK